MSLALFCGSGKRQFAQNDRALVILSEESMLFNL